MKPKKQDRNLRELFRHTLENAEVAPDPAVGARLMRKLAVREFLHFNPVRPNVYYIGGIVAAGILAVLVATSHKVENGAVPHAQIANTQAESNKREITIEKQAPLRSSNEVIAGRTCGCRQRVSNCSGTSAR